ncbi:MAG: hypothetical protein QNK04_03370 [Myxococcota bacterium]|nr:hypothetical protein [Myxococcota bacterium]
MPRSCTKRAAPVLATALAVLIVPPLAGCFYSRRSADVDRNPTVDTGMGASIIMPGQSAPAMGRGPGSAEGGIPTATPNIQMIGGSEIDEERHETGKEDPLLFKALTTPLAVLAAPFVAAAGALRGDEKPEPGPQVPAQKPERPEVKQGPPPVDSKTGSASPPSPGATQAPVQTARVPDYETEQIEAMERELAQRQARAPGPSPAPAPATPRASLSIADELAALQRAPRAQKPSAHAVPAPVETAHEPERVVSGEVAVADGIVDRDEDGRIDMWLYRQDGDIVRKVIDQDFDGRPDTTMLYDPATHRLARIEEDSDRNGATDSWTEYREGEVTRRRVDSNHDGSVDTWTFYRDGEISRHEQDTTGDGFRDRIGFYEGGVLLREDHDRNGDGRPDVTEHYDGGRKVTRREEDRDHDGEIDVISHYENGRLSRRELLGDDHGELP